MATAPTRKQCEALVRDYRPFVMGGDVHGPQHQCENPSTHVVTQLSTGDAMPLCDRCLAAFKKANIGDEALYSFVALDPVEAKHEPKS